MKHIKSAELHHRAVKVIPGGVDSNVRFFEPYIVIEKAEGARLYDVDGNEYIDFWLGAGPNFLGHGHPAVINAVKKCLQNGVDFGVTNELEIELAEKLVKILPCAEMVRFTNSGTEATMSAVRLARGYTRREKIAKAEGGFHGLCDSFLLASGLRVHFDLPIPYSVNVPDSEGVPKGSIENTIVFPFNNIGKASAILNEHRRELAAVIIEPVLGSGGVIPADIEFLKFLREFTEENDILLIFDEVATGFKLALGGAQEYYGVVPDLATYGKALGGGFPIGVFVGPEEVMSKLAPPSWKVIHGGTFSGNPISMSACLASLKILEKGDVQKYTGELGDKTRKGLKEVFRDLKIIACVTGVSSMSKIHFGYNEVKDYATALLAHKKEPPDFYPKLIDDGIFILPNHSIIYISLAHTTKDIERMIASVERVLRTIY